MDRVDVVTRQQIWERKLLDFSLRNNLLNIRMGRRVVPFVSFDIASLEDRIFDKQDFSVQPLQAGKRPQPDEYGFYDSRQYAEVNANLKSQSPNALYSYLTEAELLAVQKILYRESRTALEENGANSLFLVFGLLKWYEEKPTRPRYAPLLLMPVSLIRKNGNNYVIRRRDEDMTVNTTLVEMLHQQYSIDLNGLNPLPEDESGIDVKGVLDSIRTQLAVQPQWEVMEESLLGLFSFNKFVMWNDIHTNAEKMRRSPIIEGLLKNGIVTSTTEAEATLNAEIVESVTLSQQQSNISNDMVAMAQFDNIAPDQYAVPVDVDSSQMQAVIESGEGNSFILYGPPGTGKSQTITNMIANALYHGKRVLFVAEKMAALEVVQKRLNKIGLAPFCLELHSNKVTKSHLLKQLQSTLELTRIKTPAEYEQIAKDLFSQRQQLTAYIEQLHKKRETGLSLYDCINLYESLGGSEIEPSVDFVNSLSVEKLLAAAEKIKTLDTVFAITGPVADHPLRGISITDPSQQTQTTLAAGLSAISAQISKDSDKLKSTNKWSIPGFFAKRSFRKKIEQLKAVCTFDSEDIDSLAALLPLWQQNLDRCRDWAQWCSRKQELEALHLDNVIDYMNTHSMSAAEASDAMLKGTYRNLALQIIDSEPQLQMFNGLLFEDAIAKYRDMAKQFQELTKKMLYCRLAANVPSQALKPSSITELGILKRYIASNGRGATIRHIIDQIPTLLPQLCPVMLMSPISVAQFIDLDQPPFDIVCFDEASQMPTSEAVGAIARGKALICVGDPKQMPPTNFFATNAVDEEEADIDDMESILDDCITLSLPAHYLTWHYRSRHESLIAFSNAQYYENRLYTFPSVDDRASKVQLIPVDGVYDYGKTRCNCAEAEAIVKEVVRRLSDEELSKNSIGIVSFSKVQQNLIEDLLTEELAKHGNLEAKAYDVEEPIFIKNLENVQGDERDVILFSIGYGPDETGKVSMNFGPLNNQGGERRLNVAVSRARKEMMVFSTLTPEQIDLRRSNALGVAGLKAFLEFARNGRMSADVNGSQSNPQHPSPNTQHLSLVNAIADEIRKLGYEVDTAIGRSGFKIDLGVIDPQNPEQYLLGILCDGTRYYETPTERDREICQPGVLKGLGWKLMRVWTVDWMMNRSAVIKRIVEAIAPPSSPEGDTIVSKGNEAPSGAVGGASPLPFAVAADEVVEERELVMPDSLKKALSRYSANIEKMPAIETERFARFVIDEQVAVPLDDMKRQFAKAMGYTRRTGQTDLAIETAIAMLIDAGELTEKDGNIMKVEG